MTVLARGWHIFLALLHAAAALSIPGPGSLDVTLLVRSQDTPVDKARVDALRISVTEAGWPHRVVVSMADAERELDHLGLWTYKPWIYLREKAVQKERRRSAGGQRWLVFLEASTTLDPTALQSLLAKHDATKPLFLGRKLVDKDSCIIHHYSTDPPYPHVHAGFALSGGLIRLLMNDLKKTPLGSEQQIEPVWELAKWIKSLGVGITNDGGFCGDKGATCATWVNTVAPPPPMDTTLSPNNVIIAVKTVGFFHKDRVPLIHEFLGSSSPVQVLYLSNEAYTDDLFADVLGKAVVNLSPEFGDAVDPKKESTKGGSGHCAKMQSMLRYLYKHQSGKRWYVLTDDDTLLDDARLLDILRQHDYTKAIYIGERYGWAHREQHSGSNYMTTGAGMAMTAAALAQVVNCQHCRCASMNSPDDMTLGSWFHSLPVQMVHEESFHQAEPHNYHPEILRHGSQPVSFHRFNVRLPANSPAASIREARQKNWRSWKQTHFQKQHDHSEL